MRGTQGLKSLFSTPSSSQKGGKTRTPLNLRPYHLLSMTKRRMARSATNAQRTDSILSLGVQATTEVLPMKPEVAEQQHGPYTESGTEREKVGTSCGAGQPTVKAILPLKHDVNNTAKQVGAHAALDEHYTVAAHRSHELHAAEVTAGDWQQVIGASAPAKPRSLRSSSGQRVSDDGRYPTSTSSGISKSLFTSTSPRHVVRRCVGGGVGGARVRRRLVECSGIWKGTRRQRPGPPRHREPTDGLDFDVLTSYIVPPTEPVTVMMMTQGSAPLPFPMPVVADVATGEYFFQTMSSSQRATGPAPSTISSYSELAQALGPPASKTNHVPISHTAPEGEVDAFESSGNTPTASSDSSKALPASATPPNTVVSSAASASPYIAILAYESPDESPPALAPPLAERKMKGLRKSAMIRCANAKASLAAASGRPSNSPSLPPASVQSPANANSVSGSADEHSPPPVSPDTPSDSGQLPSPASQPSPCTSQPAAAPIASEASVVDSTQQVQLEKEGDAEVSAVERNEAGDIAGESDATNAPVHEPSIPAPIQPATGQAEQGAMVSSVAEALPPPEPHIPLSTEDTAAAGECPPNSTSEAVPWNPLQDVIDTFFGNKGIIFTPPLPPEQHAVPESTPTVVWSDYLHTVSPGSTYDTASVFAQHLTLPAAAASGVNETPLAGPSHSYAAPSYVTYEPVQTTQFSNFLPPDMSDQWQQVHPDLTAVYNSSDMPMSPAYQSPIPSSQTFAVPYAPAPYEQQMTGDDDDDDDDDDDADMVRICSVTSGMTLQEGTYDSQMGEYQGASSWNDSGVYGFPEVVLVPSNEDAAMHFHETTESVSQPFYLNPYASTAPDDQTAFTSQDPSQVFPSQSAYVPDSSEFAVAGSDVYVDHSNESLPQPTPITSEPVLPVEAPPSDELVVQPVAIEPEAQVNPQAIPLLYVDVQETTIVSAGDGLPIEESVCPTTPSVPQERSVLDVPTEPSRLETASDNPVVDADKEEEAHPNASPAPPPTDERVDDAVSALLGLSLSTAPAASTGSGGTSGSIDLRLQEPASRPVPDMAAPAERPQIPLFVLSAPSGTASSAATTKPASRRGVTARSKGAKGKLRTGASRAPGVAASGSSVTMAPDAAEDYEPPENPGCAKKARVDPAESPEAPPAAAPKPRPRKPQPPPFTLEEFTLEVLEAYVIFEDFHLHSLGFACDSAMSGDAVEPAQQEAPDPAQCVAWLADVCHLRRKLSETWEMRQKQGWNEERFLAHVQGKLKDKPLHRQAALHFFGKKTECVSYVPRTPGWYEDPAAFYSRYPDLLAHLSASLRDGRCHPPVYNDFPVIQVE